MVIYAFTIPVILLTKLASSYWKLERFISGKKLFLGFGILQKESFKKLRNTVENTGVLIKTFCHVIILSSGTFH